MKVSKLLIPTMFCLSSSVLAEQAQMSEYSKQMDQIRRETDIWTSKGALESTKKTALTDMLERVELEEMVKSKQKQISNSKSSTFTKGISISKEDFYTYAMRADATPDAGEGTKAQEEILNKDGSVMENSLGAGSSEQYDELKRQQELFFKQVQEYLTGFSGSQSNSTPSGESDDDTVLYENVAISGASGNLSGFEYGKSTQFQNFSAKIAGRTKRSIEIAFAIGIEDKDPAFLMEKISPETKEFDLHFFGIDTIRVKVLSVKEGYVVLEIDGKRVVAK